jgi:hypothetical protein
MDKDKGTKQSRRRKTNYRLGTVLKEFGLSPEKLEQALAFKQENGDVLLGEACVRLGFISQSMLDIAVKQQWKLRGRTPGEMVGIATERTKRMADAIAQLAATSSDLADKLK